MLDYTTLSPTIVISPFSTSSNIRHRHCHPRRRLHQCEEEMAGHRIAHATLKGPNLVKEIFMGITLGLAAGGLWKMHHWNEQRKTKTFYDMLERGQISVIAAEE